MINFKLFRTVFSIECKFVMGHNFFCSAKNQNMLVRSHRSLIHLLRTACFARALRYAHSFVRSLTRVLLNLWRSDVTASGCSDPQRMPPNLLSVLVTTAQVYGLRLGLFKFFSTLFLNKNLCKLFVSLCVEVFPILLWDKTKSTVSCLISAPGAFEIENESFLLFTAFYALISLITLHFSFNSL